MGEKKNQKSLRVSRVGEVTTDYSVKKDIVVVLTEKLTLKQDLKEMKALANIADFCVRAFQEEGKRK